MMIRLASLMAALSVPAIAFAQDLTAHGNFTHIVHTGESTGVILLDSLRVPSAWGVGALAGLRGEIVVLDGDVLVSRGTDPMAGLGAPAAVDEATILVYGAVTEWREVQLSQDMNPERLAQVIEREAESAGLDPEAGFPIRIQGTFPTLVWHVVTGDAPEDGVVNAGHANSQSGMNLYDEPGATGELVGVYTGATLEGIASHPGERQHLHFVDIERTRSGHLDEVASAAGTSLLLSVVASDAMDHAGHDAALADSAVAVTEGGQSAFAAIQEIVALLIADPATDWTRVDVEALRQHLIDMDNVTLRARVTKADIDGGARFMVTADDSAVITSIRAMVPAHAATMDGVEGWTMRAKEFSGGAELTVTGADLVRIRALGFIGLLTVGMHHQTHHLALASGQEPHLK